MTARRPRRLHYAWVVLGAAAVAVLAASGVRSAFGVFIQPMEAEFGWDRTALSLVASLSFLFNGATGPIVGRFGNCTVAFHSAALVAFAATLMVLAVRERPVSRRPSATVVAAPATSA